MSTSGVSRAGRGIWTWELRAGKRSFARQAKAWAAPARVRWRKPDARSCSTAATRKPWSRPRANCGGRRALKFVKSWAISTVPTTRAELIAACSDADILVNNNGGPPYKSFGEINREDILKGVESNMLTPIALVQALAPGMAERKFGRIVNITSGSVRAPIAGLDVSSGARAGLTAFLASAARLYARDNVTINSIQPGSFETDRQKSGLARAAAQRNVSVDTARAEFEGANPSRAIRRSGRVWRALRLRRQRARRIHHRSEHPHRRGRVPGGFLTGRPLAGPSGFRPRAVLPGLRRPFVSVALPTAGRVAARILFPAEAAAGAVKSYVSGGEGLGFPAFCFRV